MATKKFCVIGLGHFGMNLALELSGAGAEVLAIDNIQEKVDQISEKVTFSVCMDTTDERSLRSLGLQDMDAVIVAIGENFESSILTTTILQEIGVRKIINRIISPLHERILRQMNILELVVPEEFAAGHLARRLIIPGLIESFSISRDYGIFEIESPRQFVHKSLLEINLRQDYSLNLVTINRPKHARKSLPHGERQEFETLGVPTPDTQINEGDILVLFGMEKDVKRLLNQ